MKLIEYLFPTDWQDIETIKIMSYSRNTGSYKGLACIVVIQYSPSTKKYRKQTVTINNF